MLEDLEKYHGTVLVWAGLGGGSISLPYLVHEAFGDVDPRMQIYGYMNDSEFVEQCNRRGIKLFGIVFEVQGWEYPAVFDDKGHLIRLNRRAEESPDMTWYGLREFSAGKWPDAFPTKLSDYYPDGIKDENGDPVTDLWEECCTRDMFGNPIHAQWVEIRDHKEQCYQMCRNNPVWRQYLKKIIEIQIDAGVPGIQLDECELPMTSINSGGCFCDSCMKQFRSWLLKKKDEGMLGAEWDGIDLSTFHYGEYLKAGNHTYPKQAPLFRYYWEFQVWQVKKYFSELADYAREYAQKKYGRKLLVAGRLAEGSSLAEDLKKTGNTVFVPLEGFKEDYMPAFMDGFHSMYDGLAPVICEAENVGIQRYDNNGRTYIHLLNYRYDEQEDHVKKIPELHLVVRDVSSDRPTVIAPEAIDVPDINIRREGEQIHITLKNVGLYAVVIF